MLTNLHVENFRCFGALTIEHLARVNLFVGLNNAGKTSVLDAAEIFLSNGNGMVLWRQARRRGEILYDRANTSEVEISHLFRGHNLAPEAAFIIDATSGSQQRVKCTLSMLAEGPDFDERLALLIESRDGVRHRKLTPRGGLIIPVSARSDLGPQDEKPIGYFGTDSIDRHSLGALWDKVVLTAEEARVVEALRLIEPGVERLAYARQPESTRGSFFIKLSGSEGRVPLGSMGDGIKRLLALSLHLARSAGGSLLVDEIDTGLHYSVMVRMWRLVVETARRLDVQVFATTHSLDCILALAELCEGSSELANEVLLHRIEKGKERAVTYSADALRVAAEQHMEVRGYAAQDE